MTADVWPRTDYEECAATGDVLVIDDDIRDAAAILTTAVKQQHNIETAAARLVAAVLAAPTTSVAECPGRMIVTETGWWNGIYTETVRCDVCGRQVSS